MKKILLINIIILLFCNSIKSAEIKPTSERIEWKENSSLLYKIDNTYGAFSGIINDKIIIIGGSSHNLKEWNKNIYLISSNGNDIKTYNQHDTLHKTIAYGVSIELPEGLLCIGGRDSSKSYNNVFLVELKNNEEPTISDNWPPLPISLTNATGSLLNNKIYIAGYEDTINMSSPTKHFFMLDLSNKKKGWIEEQNWPGDALENIVSTVQSNGSYLCFYLFGKHVNESDKNDGYVFDPKLNKWKPLNISLQFKPNIAKNIGANNIIFYGKSYDKNVIWKYHTITGRLFEEKDILFSNDTVSNIIQNGLSTYFISKSANGASDNKLTERKIIANDKKLSITNILIIIGYFIVLSIIGIYFSKRQKNTNDYFKGGGRIPWWAAGLSLFGTALSAITFMAIPAKAFATNWSYLLFNTGIVFVAPIIVFLFIPFFRKLNITTAYQYLEVRFNATIRVICSLAFILFQIGRMGVVLFLPSIALNVVTGIDIFLCIGVMGICSILYTMIGGIEAVVWTDALQVIILLGGAIFAIVYIICDIPGGLGHTLAVAAADGKFNLGSINLNFKDTTVWTVLIATCFTNLTTYGTDQSMVQRYLTTATLKDAQKSVWTNALLTIPATIIFFFIGTLLYVYYKTNPSEVSMSISNGDAIFPWYIFTKLPEGISGLLISGIFAAAMSTLSGSMNSAATAFMVDIHSKIKRPNDTHSELKTARITTTVIGLISLTFAFFMATCNIASLWDEFNKILGLILGSLGGLFLLGMITKRANSTGAIIGIAVSVIVQLCIIKFQILHLLLYTTSGFISCFSVGYIASLIFGQKNKFI